MEETFVYTTEMVRDNFIHSVVNRMKEVFGDDIASPEHEPIRFQFQLKLIRTMLKDVNNG
jgi:hypothetical protein